jgi:hypothetical protein
MGVVWIVKKRATAIVGAIVLAACGGKGADIGPAAPSTKAFGGGINQPPVLKGVEVTPRTMSLGGIVSVIVSALDAEGDLIRYDYVPTGGIVITPDASTPQKVTFQHDGVTREPSLLVRVVDPFGETREDALDLGGGLQESLIRFEVLGLPIVGGIGGGGAGGSGGPGGGGGGDESPAPASPRPSSNRPPILSAGASLTVPLLGTLTLNASVSDPDGDAVHCYWDADGCIGLTLPNGDAPHPSAVVALIGCATGQIALVCVDVHGASASASWTLRR